MKILVLHSELGVLRGGGENFTRNLFAEFARRNHSVISAFVANRSGGYPIPLPPQIEPYPIKGWWSNNLGQSTLAMTGFYLPEAMRTRLQWDRIQEGFSWRAFDWHKRRFQRRIEAEFASRWRDFDAVYVHGDVDLAHIASKHRPTVLRLPGPVTAESEPTLRKVHVVCANGDALMCIRKFIGDHATELPIGIDTRLFNPGPSSIRQRLGWADHNRVIGYVGRLMHLKGVDILAAAFRRIAELDADVRLVIIGSGPEETYLQSVLARELSRGVVHIKPDVNHAELTAWYRAIDLLVMPSRYENFSNTILEAMACGVPFLASDVGGNRSLGPTGAGWLFEAGSVSSLTSCITRLLKNPDELKRRGNIAANYAREHYSWAATAECLEKIITAQLPARS